MLKRLRTVVFEFVQLVAETGHARSDANPPFGYEPTVNHLERLYHELLNDPFWDAVPASALKPALDRFVTRLQRDPVLRPVYEVLRRYNRVQHRENFRGGKWRRRLRHSRRA